MKKYLEKIKKRPIKERKKLATILAIISTLLIVIVSFVLGSILKTKNQTSINNQSNFFEKMFKSMDEKFSELGDEFSSQKEEGPENSQINLGSEENPMYIDSLE